MSQIILDFGSGNTCRNDRSIVERMIDELAKIDTRKHEIIIKWQLFKEAGQNIPLDWNVFSLAYGYAAAAGYKTTASVFDKESLNFLLTNDIPFVKIANRRDLDWLIGEVPRKIPVRVSVQEEKEYLKYYNKKILDTYPLACVSNYPSRCEEYEAAFSDSSLNESISDHAIGLDLFKKYQPYIWEKHFKLPDSTGLDAGPFAITPAELVEIL